MSMQTFTTFRLPDGSTMELVDWVDKPLFSTGEFLSGFNDEKLELFTYSMSDEVPATTNATARRQSTETDTNIATSGSLTSSEEMLVYSVRPEFFELRTGSSGASADLSTAAISLPGQPMMRPSVLKVLHMNIVVRLMLTQKAFVEAGLGYFNAGFDVYGMGTLTGATLSDANRRSYAAQGMPSAEAVRSFAIPQHIGGTEKYQLELRNYTGGTVNFVDEAAAAITGLVVRSRFYLDGMRKRPTA